MADIFSKFKAKNISMRFKLQLNECPQVASKYRYRLRMGSAIAKSSIFNAEIWKRKTFN